MKDDTRYTGKNGVRQASQNALVQDGRVFLVGPLLPAAAAALFLRDLGVEGRPSGVCRIWSRTSHKRPPRYV